MRLIPWFGKPLWESWLMQPGWQRDSESANQTQKRVISVHLLGQSNQKMAVVWSLRLPPISGIRDINTFYISFRAANKKSGNLDLRPYCDLKQWSRRRFMKILESEIHLTTSWQDMCVCVCLVDITRAPVSRCLLADLAGVTNCCVAVDTRACWHGLLNPGRPSRSDLIQSIIN